MEIRIEQKWALEELAVALRSLERAGVSLKMPNGDMYVSGLGESSVYLDQLSSEAIEKAVKRFEEDQPVPDDADDC